MVQQSKKIVFARSLAPFCFQIYLDELQVVLNSTPAFAELTYVAIRGMRLPIDPEEDRRFFDTAGESLCDPAGSAPGAGYCSFVSRKSIASQRRSSQTRHHSLFSTISMRQVTVVKLDALEYLILCWFGWPE